MPSSSADNPEEKPELVAFGGGADGRAAMVSSLFSKMSALSGLDLGKMITRDEISSLVEGYQEPSQLISKAASVASARASIVSQRLGLGVTSEPPICPYALASLMLRNGWHARCIELTAEAVAGGQWKVVQKDESRPEPRGRRALAEKARLEAFLTNVNRSQLGCDIADLVKASMGCQAMIGFGSWEITRDALGRINGLFHLPSVSIRMATGPNGGYWQIGSAGHGFARRYFKKFGDLRVLGSASGEVMKPNSRERPATELLVITVPHPAAVNGYPLPWWISALPTIETDIAASEWNSEFFRANTIPRKVFAFFGLTGESAKDNIKQYFATPTKGRNHEPLVLGFPVSREDGDMKVFDLESQHQDAGFLNLRAANRDEILALHGVPPILVGVQTPGKLGGKNDRESTRKDFKTFKIDPLQVIYERILNRVVLPSMGITRWRVQLGDLDMSDHDATLARSRETRSQVGMGLRTINEGRRVLGLSPYRSAPAADRPFIQTSSGPLFLDTIEAGQNAPGVAPEASKPDDETEGVAHKALPAPARALPTPAPPVGRFQPVAKSITTQRRSWLAWLFGRDR